MNRPRISESCFLRSVFIGALLLCSQQLAAQTGSAGPISLDAFSESLWRLTTKVAPAVVKIVNVGYSSEKDDDRDTSYGKQEITGSGVILSSDGYIVTNAHVIKGAKHIRASFFPSDSSSRSAVLQDNAPSFEAKLVGADEDTDLAVLKIDARNLPVIPLADSSNLHQGEIVLAIGSPMGMKDSVSMGIISSIARQENDDGSLILLQTDAAINSGNSGGALVDTAGRLVGITNETMDGERLGFAIPCDVVKSVYDQILKFGGVRRGELGVEVQMITPVMAKGLNLPRSTGVVIVGVKRSSPAEKADLRNTDVIVAVDGNAVGSVPEFQASLFNKAPNDIVTLEVLRGNKHVSVRVPVVARKSNNPMLQDDPENSLIRELGVFAVDLDEIAMRSMPGLRERTGVLVTGKMTDVRIIGCDLQPRDVIHAVNGKPILTLSSLRENLHHSHAGDPIVLLIERNATNFYVAFEAE